MQDSVPRGESTPARVTTNTTSPATILTYDKSGWRFEADHHELTSRWVKVRGHWSTVDATADGPRRRTLPDVTQIWPRRRVREIRFGVSS